MRRQSARVLLAALAAWACIGLSGSVSAQLPQPPAVPGSTPPATPAPVATAPAQTDQRILELEKSNQELQKQLLLQKQQMEQLTKAVQGISVPASTEAQPPAASKDDIKKAVDDALKAKADEAAARAAAEAAAVKDKWYAVGSDLKMQAKWYDGLYLQTANKDFWTHIGGWIQNDYYWWDQSKSLLPQPGKSAPKGVAGPATGGIGPLEDGDIWRRLRIQMEGGFWEIGEYNLVFAFENDQFGTVGLDEFWVGVTKIPLIGNIRIGHVKLEHNLEADGVSSSRAFTFLERSSMADAFYPNFGTGLWVFNSFLDDRVTVGGNLYRQDVPQNNGSVSGDSFGDGQYAWDARVTALPWYSGNGRCLMHLGASYSWYKAQSTIDSGTGTPTGIHQVRLRSRPEMRDADPAGVTGTDPSTNILGGNKNRLVDTGAINASSWDVVGLEYLLIAGPFSLQAEYAWATINDATGVPAGKGKAAGDFTFSGGYVQATYTLTGENRSYDKRIGRLDSYYYGRQGPYTPFWLVRDGDGGLDWGWGAWELVARYSYLDLNDGVIHGGKEDGWAAGVNWMLNTNMRLQFIYQWNDRYSLPTGVNGGSTRGLGIRANLVF